MGVALPLQLRPARGGQAQRAFLFVKRLQPRPDGGEARAQRVALGLPAAQGGQAMLLGQRLATNGARATRLRLKLLDDAVTLIPLFPYRDQFRL